jgi:hypothetical protein
MCAIQSGRRGRRVLVLDHADRVGKKILISGGGRCNFTNWLAEPECYQSQNPRFCVSALRRYTPWDFVALVEQHRIPYHEKKLGQLFCDGSAREVVQMLLAECQAAGVTIQTGTTITGVKREPGFQLQTNRGAVSADSLVVATGGQSIPKMGATGFAHDLARQFGLRVTPTAPALVPLTLAGEGLEFARSLSGVSIPVVANCGAASFAENLLFTHRGLSGPAILQISSYWTPGATVSIDLLPDLEALPHLQEQKLARPRTELATILSELLPRRFVRAHVNAGLASRSLNQLSDRELGELANGLKRWAISPSGTEGYRTAEVTRGGVDTTELSSQTMAATRVPNLYFIGEAVDVTGPLGGYNFQWAWASGFCAGQYA